MKFKELTLEEIAEILDIDEKCEFGCGQDGVCNGSCPLWCEAKSQICSTLTDAIKECKKYFDMDITYKRTEPESSPKASIRDELVSWTKKMNKKGYSNEEIAFTLGLINDKNINALFNVKESETKSIHNEPYFGGIHLLKGENKNE